MGSKVDLDNHMSCMHKVQEPLQNIDAVTDVEESDEEENDYECKVCGLILHDKSKGIALGKLINHTRVAHNMNIDYQEPHICNLCGLKTFSDNDLRLHKRNDHLTKSDSMSPPHKRIKDDGKTDPPVVVDATDNANETL